MKRGPGAVPRLALLSRAHIGLHVVNICVFSSVRRQLQTSPALRLAFNAIHLVFSAEEAVEAECRVPPVARNRE